MALNIESLELPLTKVRESANELIDRAKRMQYQAGRTAFEIAAAPAWYLWHMLALRTEAPMPPAEETRAVLRARSDLFARDVQNAVDGYYPTSLLEFPWGEHLKALPAIAADLPSIFARRKRNGFDALPRNEPLDRYPSYYRRTFHWQTDGWLSESSARKYDTGVELIFLGAGDSMRRMTLPPLVEATRKSKRARVLDIACGTGSFLRQLRAAMPQVSLVGIDLSPHYIAWAHRKVAGLYDIGLVAENAEQLSFDDDAFDHAVSIFLFHELPKDARRRVAREAFRVIAPGGLFVVSDSIQTSDELAQGFPTHLEWFPAQYHEPYYRSYVRDELGAMLQEVGFEIVSSECHYVSKCVVARKPKRRVRAVSG